MHINALNDWIDKKNQEIYTVCFFDIKVNCMFFFDFFLNIKCFFNYSQATRIILGVLSIVWEASEAFTFALTSCARLDLPRADCIVNHVSFRPLWDTSALCMCCSTWCSISRGSRWPGLLDLGIDIELETELGAQVGSVRQWTWFVTAGSTRRT